MPIVVSVPNISKCLVSVETKLNLEAVGALDNAVALEPVPPEVSHINVPPLRTVAIRSSPKLSKDQFLPATTTLEDDLGVSHVLKPQVAVPHPYQ